MSTRDLLMVAVTAVASSFLTYLAVGTDGNGGDVASWGHQADVTNETSKLSDSDNPVGPQTVESPRAATTEPETNVPQLEGNAEDRRRIEREISLRLKKQSELERNFANFLEKKRDMDPGRMSAEIESRFYQEEWDREWARDRETGIHSMFQSHAGLNNISPLNVTCRSKNCQVVLPMENQEQARELSEKFVRIVSNSDIGMSDKAVSFFPDISTGRLVFYLSENGNMDLFQ